MPRRLKEDVEAKVLWYLEHRAGWPDRRIAEQCGVSHMYVWNKRMMIELAGRPSKVAPVVFEGTVREWREACKQKLVN